MATTLKDLWDLEDRHTAAVGSPIGAVRFSGDEASVATGSTAERAETFGLVIKGEVRVAKDFVIDGYVEGEIKAGGFVTVGEHAVVRGEIVSQSITVYGKGSLGNISVVDRCELKAHGSLLGNLKSARLIIEDGATFAGASVSGAHGVSQAVESPIGGVQTSQRKKVAAART